MGEALLLPQLSLFWGACPRGAQAEVATAFFTPWSLGGGGVCEVVTGRG